MAATRNILGKTPHDADIRGQYQKLRSIGYPIPFCRYFLLSFGVMIMD